jgi:hypothetical protein
MNKPCPICNDNNWIQRVRVIWEGGRPPEYFSGLAVGTTFSNLVRLLAPPPGPSLPLEHGWAKWGNVGCIAILVLAIFILLSTGWDVMSVYLFLAVFIVLFGLNFRMQNARDAKASEIYAKEKSQYDRAMEVYNRLYFCHQDGIVFDPQTQETCQPDPDSIRSFIYNKVA